MAPLRRPLLLTLVLLLAGPLAAHDPDLAVELDPVEVQGRAESLLGQAAAASEGSIGAVDLARRPLLRVGELLEAVPGLIATQHSGSGKANQYFLRGFNLDHGTDFAVSVDGVPINLPSHGHGQGYTDLNFLIPELVQRIHFRKGPYFADVGDFSSAGSAQFRTVDRLDQPLLKLGLGEDHYRRLLAAGGHHAGRAHWVYAAETQRDDGPWTRPENLGRGSGLLQVQQGDEQAGWRAQLRGYHSRWDATDQIPLRAVQSGALGEFDSLDPTLGGDSNRVSLLGERWRGPTEAQLYLAYYDLALFSNFTYFLDDPVNGDQFEQADRRLYGGGHLRHRWPLTLFGRPAQHSLGLQLRHDRIGEVGLFRTAARERLSTVSTASIDQTALALWYQLDQSWSEALRGYAGLRVDQMRFEVAADRAENSGREDEALLTPKLGLAWTVSPWLELSANAGHGLHSNDARGTTLRRDPVSLEPAQPVDPLVRSRGAELGLRAQPRPGLNLTLTLWQLDLASELLFIGDAGSTEATRPSRRHGLEWTSFWRLDPVWQLDLDLALSRARFRDPDPAGREIPGSVERVAAAGVAADWPSGWGGSLRLRHVGGRPLTEDGRVRSGDTTLINAQLRWTRGPLLVAADGLNLADRRDHDIDYFYASRLGPEEPAEGVEDLHYHVVSPRQLRLSLSYFFGGPAVSAGTGEDGAGHRH
ncbi:MAG TPA: TonB-dependent receptor [Nevskiaceae bacterium]|nr:TonB-dependent receptor [Nevskiaceae bacterium]